MGPAIEKLWVEPRLRGFVVLADVRNPPPSMGRFISYEAGWGALRRGGGETARGVGVEPLRGVRLRVESDGVLKVARRAMERDLRRRLREGMPLAPVRMSTWQRFIPWGMGVFAAIQMAVGIAGLVTGSPDLYLWLFGGAMFGLVAGVMHGMARINVRSLGFEAGADAQTLVIEPLAGAPARRDVRSIRSMTPALGAYLIVFDDGAAARFSTGPAAAGRLFRALRREFAPACEARDAAAMRRALWRSGVIYWPIGCVIAGFMHWYLAIPGGWQVRGRPILSAGLSALTLFVAFGAMAALQMMQPSILAWLERRGWRKQRRRARIGRGPRARHAPGAVGKVA